MNTAIQIHETIGVINIITDTVWLLVSMFMIDRYKSRVSVE